MKRSSMACVPVCNTNRMVEEDAEGCYLPSHRRYAKLGADHLSAAKALAGWRKRVGGAWGQVRVEGVDAPVGETHRVGDGFPVRVRVQLGSFTPDDVQVQLCYGTLDALG